MSVVWAIVTALLAGAGAMTGQILGPIVSSARQHKLWVRDQRAAVAQAFAASLEAGDQIVDSMEWDRGGHVRPVASQYGEPATNAHMQMRAAISRMRVFATEAVLKAAEQTASDFLDMFNTYGRPVERPFQRADGSYVKGDWSATVAAYKASSLVVVAAIRDELEVK